MKKLMTIAALLMLVPCVQAAVVEVVGPTTGDVGDVLPIKVVLNYNPEFPSYGTYSSYDGYALSSLNISLHISGPGSFAVQMNSDGTVPALKHNIYYTAVWDEKYTIDTVMDYDGGKIGLISGDMAQLTGVFPNGGMLGVPGGTDVVWDLYVIVEGQAMIRVDATIYGQNDYREFQRDEYGAPLPWDQMANQHLGPLGINGSVVPPCWLTLRQCHGDIDGDGCVATADWPAFRDGFNAGYADADNSRYVNNVCADYNRDGRIDTSDWPEFRDNFNSCPPSDCQPGGTWPPMEMFSQGGVVGGTPATNDGVVFSEESGLPACWEFPTQCHGDATGDGLVDTSDWPYFRDAFGTCYGWPLYLRNVCGDFDHDGYIDLMDWVEFRDNFNKNVPSDCLPQGTWPPR